jgi:hypothetical protein
LGIEFAFWVMLRKHHGLGNLVHFLRYLCNFFTGGFLRRMGCYEAKQNDVIISEYDVEPHFILVFKVLIALLTHLNFLLCERKSCFCQRTEKN